MGDELAMSEGPAGAGWVPVGLLRAMWRYRWWIGAATVIAALAGYFGSTLIPVSYEATAGMQLEDPRQGGVFGELREGVDEQAFLLDEATRIMSTPVLKRAAQQLQPHPSVDELRDRVEGSAVVELNSIQVRATASTGQGAAEIADTVALAYQDETRDQRQERAGIAIDALERYIDELQRELEVDDLALEEARAAATRQARTISITFPSAVPEVISAAQILAADPQYQTLLLERQAVFTQLRSAADKMERIRIDAEVIGSGVRRFDHAEVPSEPAWPRARVLAALCGLLALLGASAFAWKRAENRAAAEHREDASASVGAPLLGDIPRFRPVSSIPGMNVTPELSRGRTIAVPYSPAGESFQYALSSLLAVMENDGRTPVVVVTGTYPGDGGTTTALNLGFAASHRQMRVVVIDADFRQRGLTRLCGLSASAGVSEAHGNDLPAFDFVRTGRLQVVPTGNAFGDAIAYLNSREFSHAVEIARREHDLVILDAPAVLTAADALSAADSADGVVLVVASGRTLDDLGEAARVLGQAPAPLVGCVFNRPKRPWFQRTGRR